MASVSIDPDGLKVHLSALEKLGALRGDVRVPITAIRRVRTSGHPFRELRGLRMPGTGFPGLIALGTWRHDAGRDFAALYGRRAAVIVELVGEPLQRLLIATRNAEQAAEQLRRAAGR